MGEQARFLCSEFYRGYDMVLYVVKAVLPFGVF